MGRADDFAASTPDALIGQTLDGRYQIRARIGEGGMGAVYRAWETAAEREVAIKVIDERLGRDPVAVRRFLREARLARQMSQANTIRVYDVGQSADGRLYLAMELVRGRTLAEVLAIDGPFSVARAAGVGVQLCDALEAAHGLEIVHRDLKPSNIIVLDPPDQPPDEPLGRELIKVLDFGLARSFAADAARLTESGLVVGTPRYMSPEQIAGDPPAPACDLYALGVILGELTTGGALWDGGSYTQLAVQKTSPSPKIDDVPAPLRELVGRLLAARPADRPATAAEVRGLLRGLIQDPDLEPAVDQPPRSYLGLAAIVLILAGVAFIVVDAIRRPPPGFRAPDEWDVESPPPAADAGADGRP